MASVFAVAAYVLRRQGRMTAMKLQKLVYYSQAWSLVWDGRPLFGEEIEAWVNGPVVYELFKAHQGMFDLTAADLRYGNPAALDSKATDTIDAVLDYYGEKSPQWLSDLSHAETPWLEARKNLGVGARSARVITPEVMREYYANLERSSAGPEGGRGPQRESRRPAG
jgi:uncharacterized phage-associated protein